MLKMVLKSLLKPLTITVACILAAGFLLLLVDESTITGKVTAVTSASTVDTGLLGGGVNSWVFSVFVFLIIVLAIILYFKKEHIFLKK